MAAGLIVSNSMHDLESRAHSQFERLCDRFVSESEYRANQPVYGMHGARGVYVASDEVTDDEFEEHVQSRSLAGEFPGAIGMGFIERMPRDDIDRYVAERQAGGVPDYLAKFLGSPDSPLAMEDPQYIIRMCYPRDRNADAWGLVIGSEDVRRTAIDRAIRDGLATISGKITLVQQDGEHAGFLYYVPVYQNEAQLRTPAEREKALLGVIYCPIVLHEAIEGLLANVGHSLDYAIYDGDVLAPEYLLGASEGLHAGPNGPVPTRARTPMFTES